MNKIILFSCIYIIGVFISALAQIMLKKSANKKYESVIKEYLNPIVIIAYSIFFGATLFTMYAYKEIPLSMGPILEATSYIFVPVLGFIMLKEKVGKRKIVGILFILLGIIIFAF